MQYRIDTGTTFVANTIAPQLPSDIVPLVAGFVGLDTERQVGTSVIHFPSRPTTRQRHLVNHVGPAPTASCMPGASAAGYTADQIASAYGLTSLYGQGDFGAGSTVALIEFSSYSPADVSAYAQCFGITPQITEVPVDGGAGGAFGGNATEEELDLEIVAGLAPSANILLYEGPGTRGGVSAREQYDVFQQAINDDRAQVISTSWGGCEGQTDSKDLSAENLLFEQAALQGQTIVAAAGDSGSEDCYPAFARLAVDDPASQPYVTGVGGTSLSLGPPTSDVVWNTTLSRSNPGAGGGGVSAYWPMPSYQRSQPAGLNVVNPMSQRGGCSTKKLPCREVPDVSANAGRPFAVYCTVFGQCSNGWTGLGGTSAAAPTWAALFALANASGACAANGHVGFANPALYAIAASSSYSSAFEDVVTGTNDLTGRNGGMFPATTGYDLASGLGTPLAPSSGSAGLAGVLCASPATLTAHDLPQPAVSRVGPGRARSSGGARLAISGTNLEGVTAVRFGAAPASFSLVSATKIVVVVPPGHGRVHVVVTTRAGSSARTRKDLFNYLSLPSVSRLLPASGTSRGGSIVTIIGTNFDPVRSVRFGSTAALSFQVLSKTRLKAVAPPGSGSVDVTVVGSGGTSARGPSDRFTYH